MESISLEAARLEDMLVTAVRDDAYPAEALPVLQAAALEVCELEYVLETGHAERLLWVAFQGGQDA